jgi:4-diphosphocytidyl-2-C-methyl-D-erythritol kinase
MSDTVTISAHAKTNLFLRVFSRDASGFHGIETALTLLELADEMVVERTALEGKVELSVEGADTGPAEENLAYRAAHAVLRATGNRFGIRIHLKKIIPVRAGLGGGSSDAAATLHAVNSIADHAVPRTEILQFAAALGSDVPFFACGVPMALGWNRGERLFRIAGPPGAPVLLAVPSIGISTAAGYELLDAVRNEPVARGSVVLDQDVFRQWGGIGRLGGNDFESVVFGKEPELKNLFERLAQTRPLFLRLSGSGSAMIAVYKSDEERDEAAMTIGTSTQRLIKTRTRSTPAPAPQPLEQAEGAS